jgi:NADPH:quinone reductase-like Zn-dependent oxidoreductase
VNNTAKTAQGRQSSTSGAFLGEYTTVAFTREKRTLDSLSEKPAQLSMAEASAVGVPYLAAWSALASAAGIQAGETILITGALGAVGRAAIQIAHWKKARVIGADISDDASEADAFVNAKSKDLPIEVKELTDGKGVDVVLDAVGGPMFESSLKSLRVAVAKWRLRASVTDASTSWSISITICNA